MNTRMEAQAPVEAELIQPPKPEVTFSESLITAVNLVNEGGDIIDRIKWLKRTPVAGAVGLTGAGVAGFQFGVSAEYVSTVVVAGVTPLANIATMPVSAMMQKRKIRPVLEAFEDLGDHFDGDSLEIYRQKGPKNSLLHMVWEPTESKTANPPSFTSSIGRISENIGAVAESIAIPKSATTQIGVKLPDGVEKISRQEWVKRVKKQGIKDVAKEADDLCVFTPDQLQEYKESLPLPDDEPLNTFMGALRRLQPKHASLRQYDGYLRGGSKDIVSVERSLKRKVQARQHEVVVAPYPHGAYPGVKQKVHVIGQLDAKKGLELGGVLKWLASNNMPTGESTRLLQHVGTTLQDLSKVPAMIGQMPKHKAIELCEIGAWLSAHEAIRGRQGKSNRLRPETEDSSRTPQHEGPAVRGMQQRIADRTLNIRKPKDAREGGGISLRPGTKRRSGRALLMLVGVVGASYGAAKAENQYSLSYYNENVAPLYDQKITIGKDGKFDDKRLRSQIDEVLARPGYKLITKPLNWSHKFENGIQALSSAIIPAKAAKNAYDEVPEAVKQLAQKQYKQRQQNADEDSISSLISNGDVTPGVGNAGNAPNEPVWYIQSYGNMDSEGLWPEATSNTFSDKDGLQWYNRSIHDFYRYVEHGLKDEYFYEKTDAAEQDLLKQPVLPLPETLDKNNPLLRVQRVVTFDITSPDGKSSTNYYEGLIGPQDKDYHSDNYTAINIPVLQDTVPVAASVNREQPVSAVQLPNGTYVLMAKNVSSRKEPVEVEYWLKPDKSVKPVRAVAPTYSANSKPSKPEVLKQVIKPWQKYFPNIAKMSAEDRIKLQTDYISGQFKYRVNPVKDPRIFQNSNLYANAVLNFKLANCNTANTLLDISNPLELNYVTGFHNTNTQVQVGKNTMHLSSNESHAWDVDKQGNVYDATPTSGLTDKDAAHFEENYADKFSHATNAEIQAEKERRKNEAIALAALAGAAFAYRRKLRAGGRRVKRDLAKISIAALNDQDSRLAYDVMNEAIYSEAGFDSQRYQSAKSRGQGLGADEIDSGWQNFSSFHSPKAAKKALKSSIANAQARDAKRAMRWGRRINKLYNIAYVEPAKADAEEVAASELTISR